MFICFFLSLPVYFYFLFIVLLFINFIFICIFILCTYAAVLFLMYEPLKGTHLTRDSVRTLLVDSTIATQNQEVPVSTLETWIHEQLDLSECMADMALQQVLFCIVIIVLLHYFHVFFAIVFYLLTVPLPSLLSQN